MVAREKREYIKLLQRDGFVLLLKIPSRVLESQTINIGIHFLYCKDTISFKNFIHIPCHIPLIILNNGQCLHLFNRNLKLQVSQTHSDPYLTIKVYGLW